MGSKRDRGRVRVKKIKRLDSSKALDKIVADLQTKSKRELKRLEREVYFDLLLFVFVTSIYRQKRKRFLHCKLLNFQSQL